jgi:hypothetical protein
MAFGGDPVGEWAAGNLCPRGLHAMQATTATANAKPELIEWLGPLWSKNFVDNGSTPLANTLSEVRFQASAISSSCTPPERSEATTRSFIRLPP